MTPLRAPCAFAIQECGAYGSSQPALVQIGRLGRAHVLFIHRICRHIHTQAHAHIFSLFLGLFTTLTLYENRKCIFSVETTYLSRLKKFYFFYLILFLMLCKRQEFKLKAWRKVITVSAVSRN